MFQTPGEENHIADIVALVILLKGPEWFQTPGEENRIADMMQYQLMVLLLLAFQTPGEENRIADRSNLFVVYTQTTCFRPLARKTA